MNRFEKHLGAGKSITINEEEFILKPLGTESLPLFFKAMKAFSGAKEGAEIEDILKNINDEGLNAIRDIIDRTLIKSYPDETKEQREEFGLKYMGELMTAIFELNSNTMSKK